MANEFVARKGLISLGGMTYPYTTKTSAYSIGENDYFINGSPSISTTIIFTLPTATGITGKQYIIKNVGSGTITVATTASQTIDGSASTNLAQYQTLHVESSGSGWLVINTSSGTSITNNTNNNIVTTTGTSTLNGEANLTFDSATSNLTLNNSYLSAKGGTPTGMNINVTGSDVSLVALKTGLNINVTGSADQNTGLSVSNAGNINSGFNIYNTNSAIAGTQYMMYNTFLTTNNNDRIGVYNQFGTTGSNSYGIYNDMSSNSTNVGVYNYITGTGGNQYGTQTFMLFPTGPTNKYGSYTEISGNIPTGGAAWGLYINVTGAANLPTLNNISIETVKGSAKFNTGLDPNSDFTVSSDTQSNMLFVDSSVDAVGIAQSAPTAKLHIGAGTGTANTAPLKFTGGNLNTTPESGAMEYLNTALYFTDGSGKRFILACIDYGNVTGDTTFNNNTTYADIGGSQSQVSLIGGRTYEIEAMIYVTSSSSAGAKFKWNYTGTPSTVDVNTKTIQGTSVLAAGSTSSTAFAANEVSLTTITGAQIYSKGILVTSTSGTLSMQGAQSSAVATNTVFKRGSFIKVTAIP